MASENCIFFLLINLVELRKVMDFYADRVLISYFAPSPSKGKRTSKHLGRYTSLLSRF